MKTALKRFSTAMGIILIGTMAGQVTFVKEAEGAMVPALLERYGAAAASNAPLAAKTARPIPPSRKEIGATQPEK